MKKNKKINKEIAIYIAQVCQSAYLVFGKIIYAGDVVDWLQSMVDLVEPKTLVDAATGEEIEIRVREKSKSDVYFAMAMHQEPHYTAAQFLRIHLPYDAPEWAEWDTRYLTYQKAIRGMK